MKLYKVVLVGILFLFCIGGVCATEPNNNTNINNGSAVNNSSNLTGSVNNTVVESSNLDNVVGNINSNLYNTSSLNLDTISNNSIGEKVFNMIINPAEKEKINRHYVKKLDILTKEILTKLNNINLSIIDIINNLTNINLVNDKINNKSLDSDLSVDNIDKGYNNSIDENNKSDVLFNNTSHKHDQFNNSLKIVRLNKDNSINDNIGKELNNSKLNNNVSNGFSEDNFISYVPEPKQNYKKYIILLIPLLLILLGAIILYNKT